MPTAANTCPFCAGVLVEINSTQEVCKTENCRNRLPLPIGYHNKPSLENDKARKGLSHGY